MQNFGKNRSVESLKIKPNRSKVPFKNKQKTRPKQPKHGKLQAEGENESRQRKVPAASCCKTTR